MSGGHFSYINDSLKNEIFGWTDKATNVFEDMEISELVWDVLDLIHKYDWYKSGDSCKETYLKAKDAFKKKWFNNRGVRVRRIVDEALKQCKDELYETFGFDDADCTTCKHLVSCEPNSFGICEQYTGEKI